jgi:hypothetical protein
MATSPSPCAQARLDLLLLLEQLDGGDGSGGLLLLPPLLSRGR